MLASMHASTGPCWCVLAQLAVVVHQDRQCPAQVRPPAAQVLLDGRSVGFVDRVGSQQIQLRHPSAAAALQQHGSSSAQHQRVLQMQQQTGLRELPAPAATLAGSQLVLIVHGMGRNSAATGFDLKGLVHQNATLAGEHPCFLLRWQGLLLPACADALPDTFAACLVL